MTKENLAQLKEDNNIKYIYRLPNSFYEEEYEYIIIGNILDSRKDNIRSFSLDSWFLRITAGSMLPYVCATLTKSGKIKELVNIYEKPNVLKLRKYINHLNNITDLIQECLWGEQFIKEGKVNRIDVFKNIKYDPIYAMNAFYDAVNPIYEMNLKKK